MGSERFTAREWLPIDVMPHSHRRAAGDASVGCPELVDAPSFCMLRRRNGRDWWQRQAWPAVGEVHVWTCALDATGGAGEALSVMATCLTDDEMRRASRYATPLLRERCLRARSWLRHVLGAYLGCAPAAVPLQTGPHGKPYLAEEGLAFNLAHSDARAVLVVGVGYGLGVDVEELRAIPEAAAMAGRWFSRAEVRWIAASDDGDRAFLRCWVCHEAVHKAVGAGFSIPPDAVTLTPPPRPVVTAHVAGQRVLVAELPVSPRCVAALAVAVGNGARVRAVSPEAGIALRNEGVEFFPVD
ncbi:MAG: 4'-phosphopantetheinyl transferase superfamily protein [Desulfovibrio sp.]|nr:4'-phosphopantetheinyl transferase superfamily protein [Desulfovibrio sp.]